MDKRCFRCLCIKPIADFYKHAAMGDGHLNKCKVCTMADATRHRLANLERIRAYDTARAKLPHRAKACAGYARSYRNNFPNRMRAYSAVSEAIRKGLLTRLPCEVCGAEKAMAHHPTYDLPLAVTWLCQPHHKAAHAISKEAA